MDKEFHITGKYGLPSEECEIEEYRNTFGDKATDCMLNCFFAYSKPWMRDLAII